MSPVAGRIRPKTSESGILRTKRSSPVKTRTLTKMLVPKPKKAFQSPGTQSRSLRPSVVAKVCILSALLALRYRSVRLALPGQSLDQFIGSRHPSEDTSLGLDHLQAHS